MKVADLITDAVRAINMSEVTSNLRKITDETIFTRQAQSNGMTEAMEIVA